MLSPNAWAVQGQPKVIACYNMYYNAYKMLRGKKLPS